MLGSTEGEGRWSPCIILPSPNPVSNGRGVRDVCCFNSILLRGPKVPSQIASLWKIELYIIFEDKCWLLQWGEARATGQQ